MTITPHDQGRLPLRTVAGAVEASGHTTPAPGLPLFPMWTGAAPAEPHDVDLAAATRLELGLTALTEGNMPAAFSAFAAIPEADWRAILRRFPMLPAWMEQEACR